MPSRALLSWLLAVMLLPAAEWQASMASLCGEAGDQALTAAAVGAEGIALVGGSAGPAVAGIPQHVIAGGGAGALLRIETRLGELLSVSHFPAPVQAVAISEDGAVFVAAGVLYKLDADCRTVLWQAGSGGGKRLCPDGAGGVWCFHGKGAERYDAAGKPAGSVAIGGKDFAVDVAGQRLFTCGFTPGSSKKSGNPVHVPWVRAFDWSGKQLWQMWGFTPTECDEAGDMADSHPQALHVGPDGKLYMFGDSDGGNTAYRHSPHTPGGSLGGALSGTAFTETWKAFRSVRMLFACRIDPASGDVERGTFFYGKWFNPDAKREEIGDGQAISIASDREGRVLLGGVMRCALPFTTNAVHRESAPVDKVGYWKNIVATDEAYLAILDRDFRRLEFCSGFNQGASGNYASQGLTVAVGGGGAVLAGWMRQPERDATPATATVFLRGAWQDQYGGGKDGYVATLSMTRPPGDPVERMREVLDRMHPGCSEPVLVELRAADTYGELLPRLEGAATDLARGLGALVRRTAAQALQRADSLRMADPVAAFDIYRGLARAWVGTVEATEAEARLAELAKNQSFQELLEVGKAHHAALALLDKLVAVPEAIETTLLDPAYARRNSSVLRKVQQAAQAMHRRWPNQAATASLLETCSHYGIPVTAQDATLVEQLGEVIKARAAVQAVRGSQPYWDDATFQKKNAATLGRIRDLVRAMRKSASEHPCTRRGEAIAGEFRIPLG